MENNYINVYITNTGRLKQTADAEVNQFSSNNTLRVISDAYMDEVYMTNSVSNSRSHLLYRYNDDDGKYVYEVNLNPDNITSVVVPGDTIRVILTIYGYKKNSYGFEENFTTGRIPVTVIKSNEEKQYDNSWNGIDVKNINRCINEDRVLIKALDNSIDQLQIDIKNGTIITKKAEQDKLGNVIHTTYETKEDATTKVSQLYSAITQTGANVLSQSNKYTDNIVSQTALQLTEDINTKVTSTDIIGNDATLVVKKAEQDKLGNILDKSYCFDIDMDYDNGTGLLEINIKNANNNVIDTKSVNLPLEQVVVDGYYDSGDLVLVLNNGNTIRIPVSGLIQGLATEDYVDNEVSKEHNDMISRYEDLDTTKANSDDVYDKSQTYTKQEVDSLVDINVVNTPATILTIEDNTVYDIGNIDSEVQINFPNSLTATYTSELHFSTSDVLPSISYSTEVKYSGDDCIDDNIFVPEVYSEYSIIFYYALDGVKAAVVRFN